MIGKKDIIEGFCQPDKDKAVLKYCDECKSMCKERAGIDIRTIVNKKIKELIYEDDVVIGILLTNGMKVKLSYGEDYGCATELYVVSDPQKRIKNIDPNKITILEDGDGLKIGDKTIEIYDYSGYFIFNDFVVIHGHEEIIIFSLTENRIIKRSYTR